MRVFSTAGILTKNLQHDKIIGFKHMNVSPNCCLVEVMSWVERKWMHFNRLDFSYNFSLLFFSLVITNPFTLFQLKTRTIVRRENDCVKTKGYGICICLYVCVCARACAFNIVHFIKYCSSRKYVLFVAGRCKVWFRFHFGFLVYISHV